MSTRDKDGNRVSVPNLEIQDAAGGLARRIARERQAQRAAAELFEQFPYEHKGEYFVGAMRQLGFVIESERHDEILWRYDDSVRLEQIRMRLDSPSTLIDHFTEVLPSGTAVQENERRASIRGSLREFAQNVVRSYPSPVAAGAPVPPEVMEDLRRELNTEPPEDGLEYEIVARTATKKVKTKEEEKGPIYVWGVQSSKPRNGGHFITYEVQLKDDGTTSCNCPGWVFKKSTADRGCKHTKGLEAEAKDFYKLHKKGESLPTVAPSEEQMMRLRNSKAGMAGADTSSKFNRVVDLDD